jgi:hypothetical protein
MKYSGILSEEVSAVEYVGRIQELSFVGMPGFLLSRRKWFNRKQTELKQNTTEAAKQMRTMKK